MVPRPAEERKTAMLTLTPQLQYYSSQPLNERERGGKRREGGAEVVVVGGWWGSEERRQSSQTFQGPPFQSNEA